MSLIERFLKKIWYIKISKAKGIWEVFIKYMITDIQELANKDFWVNPDIEYKPRMLKEFNKTFDGSIDYNSYYYEINENRWVIFYWENSKF